MESKMSSKQEKILDAAMHCFARYGFAKATLDDIAATIGMKKASLYYYYKNKEAIFEDAMQREGGRVLNQIKSQINPDLSATEKLKHFVSFTNEYFQKRAKMLELSVQVMIESHQMLYAAHQKMESQIVAYLKTIIEQGVAQNEFQPCNEEKVADLIRLFLSAIRFETFQNAKQQLVSEIHFDAMNERSLFMIDLMINGLKVR